MHESSRRTLKSSVSAEESRLAYSVGALSFGSYQEQANTVAVMAPMQAVRLLSRLQRYADYNVPPSEAGPMVAALRIFGRGFENDEQALRLLCALRSRSEEQRRGPEPMAPARLYEYLELSGEVGFSELATAIAHLSRHEARLLLDEVDGFAEQLMRVRDWDVTKRLAMLGYCVTTDRTSAYGLGSGSLHLLCHRAGEPMLLDTERARVLLDDVSPEGARRLLRRLDRVRRACKRVAHDERGVLFLGAMGYDGERCGAEIERCLREIALRDSLPLTRFDVMRPKEAWDELAQRLRKPALTKRFLMCDAGEELAKAFLDARAARDPELKRLFSVSGLTAYVLPRRHPLRSTMLVIDPSRSRPQLSASVDAFAA